MAVDSVRGSRRLTGSRNGAWSRPDQQVPEKGREMDAWARRVWAPECEEAWSRVGRLCAGA